MQEITNITNSPKQVMELILENNESATFRLYYEARMMSWFFDLEYNDLVINCERVCLHPNILRQFRKNIPFGITFYANNKVEPFKITSFTDGSCFMGILNKEEVAEIEESIYNS